MESEYRGGDCSSIGNGMDACDSDEMRCGEVRLTLISRDAECLNVLSLTRIEGCCLANLVLRFGLFQNSSCVCFLVFHIESAGPIEAPTPFDSKGSFPFSFSALRSHTSRPTSKHSNGVLPPVLALRLDFIAVAFAHCRTRATSLS